jgi:1,2-diacylglycerol 3-beta-galactosyltransferase
LQRHSQSTFTPGIFDAGCQHQRIALVYFNAGGGHRAAALALQSELERQRPDREIALVDLFHALDPDQRFRRMTGFAPEAYYNKRLAIGFTAGLAPELKLLQATIRLSHRHLVRRLSQFWREVAPHVIVSLVPNFNRAIADSLQQACGDIPFITIMTDLADLPPHFWVEPGYTQHLICGTAHAAAQAIEQGIEPRFVHLSSGMLLSPRFYESVPVDRSARRYELGFDATTPVGLVMFGGHGSSVMKKIALRLDDRPLIMVCGRNESLRRTLAGLPARAVRHVVGFTENVAQLMWLADYFIGKPGPGSLSEALHCGLPVIVTRNAWTMPQERWNTDWIRDQQLGRVLPSFAKIDLGVDALIAELDSVRARVCQLRNNALFEIPKILESILADGYTRATAGRCSARCGA